MSHRRMVSSYRCWYIGRSSISIPKKKTPEWFSCYYSYYVVTLRLSAHSPRTLVSFSWDNEPRADPWRILAIPMGASFLKPTAKPPFPGIFLELQLFQWVKKTSGWWFLATPLKNMSSSIGMMTEPQYFWENKIDVPNHQPEIKDHESTGKSTEPFITVYSLKEYPLSPYFLEHFLAAQGGWIQPT